MSSRNRPGNMKAERGRCLRYRIARRDGRQCFYCRTPFPDMVGATLDHYLPYALWPANYRFNLVLACEPCNTAKGCTLPLGLLLVLRAPVRRDELEVAA